MLWAFRNWRMAMVLLSALMFISIIVLRDLPRDILHAMVVLQWSIICITLEDLLTRRVAGMSVMLYFLYGTTLWICVARLAYAVR